VSTSPKTSPQTAGQPPSARPPFPAVVELAGRVAPDLVAYVQQKIGTVLGHTGRAALAARVRIVRHEDPARERPVAARASVNLAGATVHARAEAGTAREAADLLIERLDQRIARISRTRRGDRLIPTAAAVKARVTASGDEPCTGAASADAAGSEEAGTAAAAAIGVPEDDAVGAPGSGDAPANRTVGRPGVTPTSG
jgi:hypothetical protein